MCRKVTCDKCGKATYAGCGRHIDDVLGDVPLEERCVCPRENEKCQGCKHNH